MARRLGWYRVEELGNAYNDMLMILHFLLEREEGGRWGRIAARAGFTSLSTLSLVTSRPSTPGYDTRF